MLSLLAGCSSVGFEPRASTEVEVGETAKNDTGSIESETSVREFSVDRLESGQVSISPRGDRAIILDSRAPGASLDESEPSPIDTLSVIEIGGTERAATLDIQAPLFSAPQFSEDGRFAYLRSINPYQFQVVDLEGLVLTNPIVAALSDFRFLENAVVSPDGLSIMGYVPERVGTSERYLNTPAVRAIDSSGPEFVLDGLSGASFVFTERENRILVASNNRETRTTGLYVANVNEADQGEFVDFGWDSRLITLDIISASPTGRFVFVSANYVGAQLPLIYLIDTDNGTLKPLFSGDYPPEISAYSPDESLAIADQGRVVNLETGQTQTWSADAPLDRVLNLEALGLSAVPQVSSIFEGTETGEIRVVTIDLLEIVWGDLGFGRKIPITNFTGSGSIELVATAGDSELIVVELVSGAEVFPERGKPATYVFTKIDIGAAAKSESSGFSARWFAGAAQTQRLYSMRTEPLTIEVRTTPGLELAGSISLEGLLGPRPDTGAFARLGDVLSRSWGSQTLALSLSGERVFIPISEGRWDEATQVSSASTTIYSVDALSGNVGPEVSFDFIIQAMTEVETADGFYLVLQENYLNDSPTFLARWQPGEPQVEVLADLRAWESDAFAGATWMGDYPEAGKILTTLGFDIIYVRDSQTGQPGPSFWLEPVGSLETFSRLISVSENSTLGLHSGDDESAVSWASLASGDRVQPTVVESWGATPRPAAALSVSGQSYFVVRGAEISEWSAASGELLRSGTLTETVPEGFEIYGAQVGSDGDYILLLAATNDNLDNSLLLKASITAEVWADSDSETSNTEPSTAAGALDSPETASPLRGLIAVIAVLLVLAIFSALAIARRVRRSGS